MSAWWTSRSIIAAAVASTPRGRGSSLPSHLSGFLRRLDRSPTSLLSSGSAGSTPLHSRRGPSPCRLLLSLARAFQAFGCRDAGRTFGSRGGVCATQKSTAQPASEVDTPCQEERTFGAGGNCVSGFGLLKSPVAFQALCSPSPRRAVLYSGACDPPETSPAQRISRGESPASELKSARCVHTFALRQNLKMAVNR
jgi:hypothetical protein